MLTRNEEQLERPVLGASNIEIKIFCSFEDVKSTWNNLQSEATNAGYHSYEWAKAWVDTLGKSKKVVPIIIVGMLDKSPVFLIPMYKVRNIFRSTLHFIGDKHSNFNIGLWNMYSYASKDIFKRIFECITDSDIRIHAIVMRNMPLKWQGFHNPILSLSHQPSPSYAYKTQLSENFDLYMQQKFSGHYRKNIRKKEKALSRLGEVKLEKAQTVQEVKKILSHFFRQKSERMKAIGLYNVFAEKNTQDFLRQAALADLEKGKPAINLFALKAGETIVATFGCVMDQDRISAMFISTASGDVEKCSPGILIILHVLEYAHRMGYRTLDLGIGEASYKTQFCEEVEPLVDCFYGLNLRGQLIAFGWSIRTHLKRFIKHSPFARSIHPLQRLQSEG